MSVFVADEQSQPVDSDDLAAIAAHVLRAQGVPEDMELSLLLVDEPTMASLNEEHLDGDGPTDVLAFPIDRPGEAPDGVPSILGDVVLCPPVAARQAEQAGHPPEDELRMLTVHGILHLLGMDHAEPDEEQQMFGRTDELLASYRRDAT
ncbi:MAG: rRNA maturation RNase YbeY [Actinobacteria bacterium]|nr:rRNA maturation RNase YbeY [Actinomycetota bacterium]